MSQSCPKTGAATNAPSLPKSMHHLPNGPSKMDFLPKNFSSWTSTLVGRTPPGHRLWSAGPPSGHRLWSAGPPLDIDFGRPDPPSGHRLWSAGPPSGHRLWSAGPPLDIDFGRPDPLLDIDFGRPDPLLDIDFSRPDPFLDIEFGGPRPSIPVEPCSQVRSRTCQLLQNSTLAHRKWRRKPNRNSGCEMLGGFLRIK